MKRTFKWSTSPTNLRIGEITKERNIFDSREEAVNSIPVDAKFKVERILVIH